MTNAVGGFDLSANTDTLIYTCPSSTVATKTVTFVARTQAATVRLAHTTGGSPASTDYYAYGRSLAASKEYEKSGIFLNAGEKLYARADATGVSVVVTGPEEAA